MNDYAFHIDPVDLHVALDCEAARARGEGFPSVAKRQSDSALHVRNAMDTMQKLRPEGYRIETKITFSFVPDVNAHLKDEFRH